MQLNSNKNLIYKLFILTLLVAIAFSLRLYYINHTIVDTPIRADAKDYYSYAVNIKTHHIYSRSWPSSSQLKPDTLRSPGYPFFISGLVSWPPTTSMVWTISFWQALIDTLTVLMTYFLAQYLLGNKLALLTAFLAAISPHLISATSYVLTETLFCFLMTASLLALVIAINKKSRSVYFLVGVLLALASLTRPTIQYFIVPLVISLFITQTQISSTKKFWPALILGFFISYTPWIARNVQTLGATSDSTLTINTLHHGIYPDFMYQSIPETKGAPYRFDPKSSAISSSVHSVLDEIKRRFENEPVKYLKWYLLEKPVYFFSWDIIAGYGDVFIYPIIKSPYLDNPIYAKLYQVMYWLHWPLVLFSLCTCIAIWLPNKILNLAIHELIAIRMLSLVVLYFVAVHIVGAPFPRYSIPLRPLTYVLALWPISFCFRLPITKGVTYAK